MKITRKWLKKHDACKDAVEVFAKREKEFKTDKEVIDAAMKRDRFDWANWCIVRLMNKKQRVQYVVFSAELGLPIFEKRYPAENRPRKVIEAAKAYLKRPCRKTKKAAWAAATWADWASGAAASASAAAVAASGAAWAAWAAAAWAAVAASGAAWVAGAADAAKTQRKIINYGLKLLEKNI